MSTAPAASAMHEPVAAAPSTAPSTPPPSAPPSAPVPAAAQSTAVPVRCENCGAAVAGRYCGSCGQRLEPPLHSLWHFMKVATEELTHADSRIWRTLLALLFKPGFLTREFLAGRRARYLPPLRLYLILSVLFFVWAATGSSHLSVLQISANDHGAPKTVQVPALADARDSAVQQRNQRECAMIDYEGPWQARLAPAMRAACLKIRADNGRSLQEAYLRNLPRAMFLFLPLLAGVMMLLYWRPRHYYVEHLLLFVHNHAFVFLIVMLGWSAAALLAPASRLIKWAVVLYVLWYVYRSVRVVYGQGRGLTLAKLTALSFFYLVLGMLMFGLNIAYSALTLE